MDFLKSLFGIKISDKSININGLKSENLVKLINDQISNLINLGLSPIPANKEYEILQQGDLNRCMIRIIYFIDILLNDRLNLFFNSDKKYDMLNSNHSFNSISEKHYWVYISKYFNIPTVKFLNVCNLYNTNQEKGFAWITISILENTLYDSIREIYTMNFDKKFYEKDSNLVDKKSEILKAMENLSNFNLLNSFNVEIYKIYINDKNQRNANRKNLKDFDMGLDVPGVSPIQKRISQNFLYTPIDLNLNPKSISGQNYLNNNNINNINSNFQPSSNFYNSKDNISTLNIYQSKISVHNIRDLNSKTDDILNLINGDETEIVMDDNDDLLPDNDEEKELDNIKEKDHPRNTKIISSNDANMQFKDNKLLGLVKKGSFLNNQNNAMTNSIKSYNVSKYMDIQHCLKDNFFSNIFEKSNSSANLPISKENISNFANVGQNSNKRNADIKTSYNNRDIPYIPFDKYFRISKKAEKDKFSRKDIIYYNNTQIKMTNSIVFYLNNFFKQKEFFRFDTKLNNEKPITIQAQNYQCQHCRKKFPKYLNIFPFRKVFWCSYYKRYICEACVSNEFSIIPAFVLKKWNFKKFSVSKQAIELLRKWYDKPIIYFKSDDPLIKTSSMLKQAIVIKRKIHKIFDIMKCSKPDEIAYQILGEYNYLVLKENLFSLKDLCEIYDGTFILKIKDFMFKLENHIKNECQVK